MTTATTQAVLPDRARDALYLTVNRLLRLAKEGKIAAQSEHAPEVSRLLHDAAGAAELADGSHHVPPMPVVIGEEETIVAQPVERRKDWK